MMIDAEAAVIYLAMCVAAAFVLRGLADLIKKWRR